MNFGAETEGSQIVEAFKDEVKDKTIVITGPSHNSLGGEAAILLASASPAHIYLLGRNQAKIQPVIDQIATLSPGIQVDFVKTDLANNATIRSAAATIASKVKKVDILVNAAGIMATRPYAKSADGIETQFAANHIGHFLLTELLLEKLTAAGKARVVNLTSMGYEMAEVNFDDPNFENGKTYDPWVSYGQSKTANILHARGITEKHKAQGVLACAVHPGLIPESGLQSNSGVDMPLFMEGYKLAVARNDGKDLPPQTPRTLQQGCATVLLAALDPSLKDEMPALMLECKAVPAKEYAAIDEAFINKQSDYLGIGIMTAIGA